MKLIATLVSAFIASSTVGIAADLKCARIRLVGPYVAGGATDAASRLKQERLEAALQAPVVIEICAGVSGRIGIAYVAQSAGDGCALVVNGAVIATFPDSFTMLAWDPMKDRLRWAALA